MSKGQRKHSPTFKGKVDLRLRMGKPRGCEGVGSGGSHAGRLSTQFHGRGALAVRSAEDGGSVVRRCVPGQLPGPGVLGHHHLGRGSTS